MANILLNYDITCARAIYGTETIDRVLDGEGAPSADDYGASAAPDWPKDHVGNYLTARESASGEDTCCHCLQRILAAE